MKNSALRLNLILLTIALTSLTALGKFTRSDFIITTKGIAET